MSEQIKTTDINQLEAIAKERKDEPFFKGSGVLKLISVIREQQIKLAQKSSAESVPAGGLTDSEIGAVFLANGFTVKPGQDGLMRYVIDAARALIVAHEAKRENAAPDKITKESRPA